MTMRTLLMSTIAASFCAVLSAQAQVVQPDPSQPGGFPLKDGAAKPLIQEKCVACHDLRRVVNANKDPEEWSETVAGPGAPQGKHALTIASVGTPFCLSSSKGYPQIQGTLDATLPASPSSTASGTVSLRATF